MGGEEGRGEGEERERKYRFSLHPSILIFLLTVHGATV